MTSQRWRQVNDLFNQALKLAREQRQAFLHQVCQDTQLRQQVADLLESDEELTEDFLRPCPANVKSQMNQDESPGQRAADSLVGKMIGAYEIKRLLGRGGMGNVYLAARSTDYNQSVAIKLLKRGMDSDQILHRFRTEIRVLAALSKHPNIAGLLDAGTTEDGLPFFVMEYVEGQRIDEYCDSRRLTISERLRLFRSVCAAVHYAHQHTVVHRDIKPGNILVTADGVPKLIDFGIAKLTTPELGGQTATPTRTEERFMTPEYASPEQIRGDSITTASDVYSLGVVLYELLCGHRPFRFERHTIHEMEWIVCQQEPEKPSTAVSRGETVRNVRGQTVQRMSADHLCANRGAPPRKMQALLTGDLDNIALKALRKEPQRRYSSVERFSRDIQKHLDGDAVDARPIGVMERSRRWVQRNPVPVGLMVAVVLGALFGLWHLSRLNQQLVRATALESAEQQTEMLKGVHDFYARMVEPLPEHIKKEVYAPATFTIELGKDFSRNSRTGMQARLFSDMPFKMRKDGGPRDGFERQALEFLKQNPDEMFYRFEDYRGRPSLRFAVGRRMADTCVKCHNEHEHSPKRDWKTGDLAGAHSIIRPLDADVARIHQGLRGTFSIMSWVSATLFGLTVIVLVLGRRRRMRMKS